MVLQGVSLAEHVRGTLGVTGWSALFTTTRVIVVRTCVSGVGSPSQPASMVPA